MRTRLDRAIDKRDDLRHYLDKWGFGLTPSEVRRQERRIIRAEAKVARLRSKADR